MYLLIMIVYVQSSVLLSYKNDAKWPSSASYSTDNGLGQAMLGSCVYQSFNSSISGTTKSNGGGGACTYTLRFDGTGNEELGCCG